MAVFLMARVESVRRAAIDAILALILAKERSAVLLEVFHAHGRKGRRRVMLCGVVMHLVDRTGRVYDMRLDSLFLNDWLDSFVDMVVDMLAANGWSSAGGMLAFNLGLLILVLAGLGSQAFLHLARVVMLVGPLLSRHEAMMVLLRERLGVIHRLLCRVIVVLMNLTVNGRCGLIVLCTVDLLLLHSRGYLFVDASIVLTILGAAYC